MNDMPTDEPAADPLRARLRRANPMHRGVPVEPWTSESSRTRLEQIMSTPVTPVAPQPSHTPGESPIPWGSPRRSRWVAAIAGVAAAAIVGVGAVAILGGDDASEPVASAPPATEAPGKQAPLRFSMGEGDGLASCLPFDVATLAGMSPAFAATVVAIDGDVATLQVDKWYAGGDNPTVELVAPSGMEALIGGFTPEVGQQYLITASEGTVNYCGYSGPATPEFTAAFDQAFG